MPLTGTSEPAISGATILSVSLVFTGLMFLASYRYSQRLNEHRTAIEEATELAELIALSEKSIVRIKAHGARLRQRV